MEQHIGLGQATEAEEVRIRWPAAYSTEEVLHHLAADAAYRLREGSATAQPLPRHAFALGQHALHPDALHQATPGMTDMAGMP